MNEKQRNLLLALFERGFKNRVMEIKDTATSEDYQRGFDFAAHIALNEVSRFCDAMRG